jgi:[ribosomal protein S18]-alanine N-acetyltransferase
VSPTAQSFLIRDFEAADFETLWRIDQNCFPPGISYSRTELRTYMRRQGSFTLVVLNFPEWIDSNLEIAKIGSSDPTDGAIAGFVTAEAQRRTGHIITIDVIASARRHGVGSLLLAGAEERLRTDGCRMVELEAAVDNRTALVFYKRHGYSVAGTIPHYYSNGVDALVLQKWLTAEKTGEMRK